MRTRAPFSGSLALGSLAVFASIAASVAACSSDSSGPKGAPAPTTSSDASSEPVPSTVDSGSETETSDAGDAGTSDGAVVEQPEQVAVRFGGYSYKLKQIETAEVGADSIVKISASEGVDGGAAIDLFFDPTTGTFACASGSHAKVVFNDGQDVYQAFEATGVCSIVVTQVGAVGAAIDGTFTATVQKGASTLQGNGSFHVLRKN